MATRIYAEEYSKYLLSEGGSLLLPIKTENREPRPEDEIYGSFQSVIESGVFKSFRIEEEEGCITWWNFEVTKEKIRFSDSGGC